MYTQDGEECKLSFAFQGGNDMYNTRFDEFLNRQQIKQTESTQIDWAEKRNEWLKYLDEFYKTIESYLKPYISEGKIDILYGKKKIFEESIGEYEVRTATILLGGNKLKFEPIGTNLIAAKGRVDMIGPKGKIKFVLVDSAAFAPKLSTPVYINGEEPLNQETLPEVKSWAWKIATPSPQIKYFALEPESFFDALMEISNE